MKKLLTDLESKLERDCCKIAIKEYGVSNIKLQKAKGYPDRMFMKDGRIKLIEFKRPDDEPGKWKPSKFQALIHKELLENGFIVAVIDNENDFRKEMRLWLKR